MAVTALPDEDSGDPIPESRTHRGVNARLVIDHHIVPCGKRLLDLIDVRFLVIEHKSPLSEMPGQSRHLQLVQLELNVSITQQDRQPHRREVCQYLRGARIDKIGEREIPEPLLDFRTDEPGSAGHPVPPSGLGQTDDPRLLPDLLVQLPEHLAAVTGRALIQDVGDPNLQFIVVDQRVVEVDEEDKIVHGQTRHRAIVS